MEVTQHIHRVSNKKKICNKVQTAWFNLTWLTFQKQRPSEYVWTAEFLVYYAVWYNKLCHMLTCVWRGIKNSWTDTKWLQWSECSVYHSLVLQMDVFYFLWKEQSYHCCHALGSISDPCQNVLLWTVSILIKTSRELFCYFKCCFKFCNKWVPVTLAWCIPGLWMKERPPIWRTATKILNTQSWTANKGRTSSLEVGWGPNNLRSYGIVSQ